MQIQLLKRLLLWASNFNGMAFNDMVAVYSVSVNRRIRFQRVFEVPLCKRIKMSWQFFMLALTKKVQNCRLL